LISLVVGVLLLPLSVVGRQARALDFQKSLSRSYPNVRRHFLRKCPVSPINWLLSLSSCSPGASPKMKVLSFPSPVGGILGEVTLLFNPQASHPTAPFGGLGIDLVVGRSKNPFNLNYLHFIPRSL
jgi:hypothetical protein